MPEVARGLRLKDRLKGLFHALRYEMQRVPEPIATEVGLEEFKERLQTKDLKTWLAVMIGEEVSRRAIQLREEYEFLEDDYFQFQYFLLRNALLDNEMCDAARLLGTYYRSGEDDPPEIARVSASFIEGQLDFFVGNKKLAQSIIGEIKSTPSQLFFHGTVWHRWEKIRVAGFRTEEGLATITANAAYALLQYASPTSESSLADYVDLLPDLIARGVIADRGNLADNFLAMVELMSGSDMMALHGVLLVVDNRFPGLQINRGIEGGDSGTISYAFYRGSADKEGVRGTFRGQRYRMTISPDIFAAVIRNTVGFQTLLEDISMAFDSHDAELLAKAQQRMVEYFLNSNEFDVEFPREEMDQKAKAIFARNVFLSICGGHYQYEAAKLLTLAEFLRGQILAGTHTYAMIKDRALRIKDTVDSWLYSDVHLRPELKTYVETVARMVYQVVEPLAAYPQRVSTT